MIVLDFLALCIYVACNYQCMFCRSISQMVVDTICVVRSQDRSECVNQDVLFLGTSESTVAVFVREEGLGGGGGGNGMFGG